MKCIILCGGYATRLQPITLDKSKVLLPIKGKPILNYILEEVEKIDGVDEIFIVTNAKFYEDFADWKNFWNFRKPIKVLNDGTNSNENRLGGIGDLWFVIKKEQINDDLLILCGDNYFDFDLNEIIGFFNQKKQFVNGLVRLDSLEEAKRFGVIEIDENYSLLSFEEKPEKPKSTYVSAGIYIFPEKYIHRIAKYMETDNSKEGPGYLISYFLKEFPIYAFPLKGFWYDVGSIETYKKVNEV